MTRLPHSTASRLVIVMVMAGALLCGGGLGCLIPNASTGTIQVPREIMRGGPPVEAAPGRSRYVVKMTDGDHDWEFQLPEIATAYEVRVPLRGNPNTPMGIDQAALTAADKEIVEQRRFDDQAHGDDEAARAGGEREGEREGEGDGAGRPAPTSGGPRPAAGNPAAGPRTAPRASYLLTLAKVKELYRTRNYELALVELVALEREYPNDERILAMKGSLYEKVGRKQLAREAWEAALAINPYNLQVAEALQRLRK